MHNQNAYSTNRLWAFWWGGQQYHTIRSFSIAWFHCGLGNRESVFASEFQARTYRIARGNSNLFSWFSPYAWAMFYGRKYPFGALCYQYDGQFESGQWWLYPQWRNHLQSPTTRLANTIVCQSVGYILCRNRVACSCVKFRRIVCLHQQAIFVHVPKNMERIIALRVLEYLLPKITACV